MSTFAMHSSSMEEPWEVKLLRSFCRYDASLDKLGYARQSVLAAAWFVASETPPSLLPEDVCLCGEGRLGGCVVRQWVEFYAVRVRKDNPFDSLSRDAIRSVLEELNSHLSGRIFMAGYKLCLADILLYYGLHRYLATITFQQKMEYVHMCRWFDQVQHFDGVRPFDLPLIVFHKTPKLLVTV